MKPVNDEASRSRIQDLGVAMQCYPKSERECVFLQQHYCTEKSASSGYYSSNICSTSSIDDHIYSEPVIDMHPKVMPIIAALESSAAKNGYRNVGSICCKTTDANVDDHLFKVPFQSITSNMAHYPKHASFSRSQTYFPHREQVFVPINERTISYQLPTIMEGLDDLGPKKSPNVWSDTDDSLMDIDMDSFLHANEKRNSEDPTWEKQLKDHKFFDSKDPADDVLENNYKCARYVNSCPEDAYKVESLIECFETHTPDKPSDFTSRSYWDDTHIKYTNSMLEDIGKKLCDVSFQAKSSHGNSSETNMLHANIEGLQTELENYWKIGNRNCDLEIRQLCASIINDEKLVAITKAFEKRNFKYQKDQAVGLEYGPARYSTIRCSNPNFKMKRKILKKVFTDVSDEDKFVEDSGRKVNGGEICQTHPSFDPFENTSPVSTSPLPPTLPINLRLKHSALDEPNYVPDLSSKPLGIAAEEDEDKNGSFGHHSNKPSIWQQYYGTRRINQTLVGKRGQLIKNAGSIFSYHFPARQPSGVSWSYGIWRKSFPNTNILELSKDC